MLLRILPLLLLPLVAHADTFTLTARSRVANPTGPAVRETKLDWKPSETAFVVCDMWDEHWCKCATTRVGAIAPRMDAVLKAARAQGAFVIHAPSDCMGFYKDAPQRQRAQSAPKAANLPKDIGIWCRRLADEPPLPIDDSDGGCDDVPAPPSKRAWTRQHPGIAIADADAISDSGVEIWNLLAERGIRNVVVMGVHTNMCVLGRPFGLRQLSKNGKNVVLARDLTDAMYNPAKSPFVSHRRGTELVVEHIETHVCPSIHSADLFGDAPVPHVVFLVGEDEYKTETTLPAFAKSDLEPRGVKCTFVHANVKDKNDFAGIEDALKSADLLVVSVRRRLPSPGQLKAVRDYLESGQPLVGIRTASHAFEPKRGEKVGWFTFDTEVLGGSYTGHYSNSPDKGPPTVCRVVAASAKHPILMGVPAEFESKSSLYKNATLAKGATPLLVGTFAESRARENVAWTHTFKGARVFYTSLGGPEDFAEPAFRRLLLNGILWASDRPVPTDAK